MGLDGVQGRGPGVELELPFPQTQQREQSVHGRLVATDLETREPTFIKPHTADPTACFDPQLARLAVTDRSARTSGSAIVSSVPSSDTATSGSYGHYFGNFAAEVEERGQPRRQVRYLCA